MMFLRNPRTGSGQCKASVASFPPSPRASSRSSTGPVKLGLIVQGDLDMRTDRERDCKTSCKIILANG